MPKFGPEAAILERELVAAGLLPGVGQVVFSDNSE